MFPAEQEQKGNHELLKEISREENEAGISQHQEQQRVTITEAALNLCLQGKLCDQHVL